MKARCEKDEEPKALCKNAVSIRDDYLPELEHVEKPVVLLQVAVKVSVYVDVDVVVTVRVPKAKRNRPFPISAGTWNPGWTT